MYCEFMASLSQYPLCRTRIAVNLLITPSTQRNYERKYKGLTKRVNWTKITKQYIEGLGKIARARLYAEAAKNKKFKQTPNGIFRQEGNSYKSRIVIWKKNGKCARLRLSQDLIQKYKASKLCFYGESNTPGYTGLRRSRPFVQNRKDIHKNFAAVKRGATAILANAKGFEDFEPFAEYSQNGDLHFPLKVGVSTKSSLIPKEYL
jgi:hypothetical protein